MTEYPVSEGPPHIDVAMADYDLDVYVDGERLDFADGYTSAVELDYHGFRDEGESLVVWVSWDGGLSVGVEHLDRRGDGTRYVSVFECERASTTDSAVTFEPKAQLYDFVVELRKVVSA